MEGTRVNQALYQKNKIELTHLLSKVLTELLVPFRNEPVISEGVRSTTRKGTDVLQRKLVTADLIPPNYHI